MPKLETRNSKLDPAPAVRASIRDFTDLDVWAALSVTANIAEGFGRYSYQENIQFCRHARGSAYELRDLLIAASDQNYISRDNHDRIDLLAQRVIQTLNGYIRATQERQRSGTL